MAWLWIAIGGAAGSVLRFYASGWVAKAVGHPFLGTMFVNVTGSLIIGFVAGLGPIKFWEQLLMIGLMGGFTTFSSFSLQTLQLLQEGRWSVALSNMLGSMLLCLLAVWLGHLLGTLVRR